MKTKYVDIRILNFKLVAVLESLLPDFHVGLSALQASVSPVLRYPDGSLEYELHPETQSLWQAWIPRRRLPVYITGLGNFRSLPPFQPALHIRWHALESTEEHEKWVDPSGCIQFAPGVMQNDYPQSMDLSHLCVTLGFCRRVRPEVQMHLVAAIRDWHASISEAGMFGEGAVRNVSSEVEFQGRRAQFWLDASETGQRTINWLVLSIVNASYGLVRLSAVIFNDVENLAIYDVEPGDGELIRVPLKHATAHVSHATSSKGKKGDVSRQEPHVPPSTA